MNSKARMGRTRKNAAMEGRRVLAIGKVAGLDEFNNDAYDELAGAVNVFEQSGAWDAEFLGPISQNIIEAGHAAQAVLDVACPVVAGLAAKRRSEFVQGGVRCSECECVNAHADDCSATVES